MNIKFFFLTVSFLMFGSRTSFCMQTTTNSSNLLNGWAPTNYDFTNIPYSFFCQNDNVFINNFFEEFNLNLNLNLKMGYTISSFKSFDLKNTNLVNPVKSVVGCKNTVINVAIIVVAMESEVSVFFEKKDKFVHYQQLAHKGFHNKKNTLITSIAIDSYGKTIIEGTRNGSAYIWKWNNQKQLYEISQQIDIKGSICSICILADGQYIVIGSAYKKGINQSDELVCRTEIWKMDGLEYVYQDVHETKEKKGAVYAEPFMVGVRKQERFRLCASFIKPGTIHILERSAKGKGTSWTWNNKIKSDDAICGEDNVKAVQYSGDGNLLVIGDEVGTIYIYQREGSSLNFLQLESGLEHNYRTSVRHIAISEKGEMIAFVLYKRVIVLARNQFGKYQKIITFSTKNAVSSMNFSSNQMFVVGLANGIVKVYKFGEYLKYLQENYSFDDLRFINKMLLVRNKQTQMCLNTSETNIYHKLPDFVQKFFEKDVQLDDDVEFVDVASGFVGG